MTSRSAHPHGRHLRRGLIGLTAVLGCFSSAALAASGSHNWFASPNGTGTTCSAHAPCGLTTAIAKATAGDTVIVTRGTYTLTGTVTVDKAITVRGTGDALIVAPSPATYDAVRASAGATLDGLQIETQASAPAPGFAALVLDGATGQDLKVSAGANDTQAAAVVLRDTGATTPTLLRTSLITSAAAGGSALRFTDGATPGTATALNVTAVCTGSCGAAITGEMTGGTATVKNTIAVGGPVTAQPGTGAITLTASDLASASGPVVTDATDLTVAPVFSDSTDYTEAASSPTVGAGESDPAMTAEDLDDTTWATPPDMGARQYVATTTTTTTTTTSTPAETGTTPSGNTIGVTNGQGRGRGHLIKLPAASAPVAGVSVTLRHTAGTVLVELPHTATEVPLARAAELPVGTVVDATRGSLTLTSAIDRNGATKTGTFSGGAFTVTQTPGANPLTTLKLAGSSFARACTVHAARLTAGALARRPSPRVVRQLWGRDSGGRFVTVGRAASATVRGTVWLTQDRCDGTLVKVLKGRVLVHDDRRHRNVLVTAGHAYLAHAAR